MPKKKAPKTEAVQPSESELSRLHARWMFGISSIRNICMTAVVGFWAWAVVYAGVYLPVRDAPGTKTILEITQNWIFNANLHVYVAWGAAAAATAYGLSERRKRISERGEKDERIVKLETQLDPNRTSSGLSIEGERRENAL